MEELPNILYRGTNKKAIATFNGLNRVRSVIFTKDVDKALNYAKITGVVQI